jgi:hypothetical protein
LNCKTIRSSLWDYTSGLVDERDRAAIDTHLNECHECVLHRGEVRSLRSGLRSLSSPGVPQLLNTRLRVLASRDRSRKLIRRDFSSRFFELRLRARRFFDNLLKPFALPAAGGILASSLCFATVVDTLHMTPDWQNDLPAGVSTQVAINELTPFSCQGRDVMVQLSVDARGNVTDFELPQAAHATSEELQEIGNLVLYSTFTPAVRLGQRVPSKQYVYISHYTVKG